MVGLKGRLDEDKRSRDPKIGGQGLPGLSAVIVAQLLDCPLAARQGPLRPPCIAGRVQLGSLGWVDHRPFSAKPGGGLLGAQ
eukprot:6817336-Pyramimonas_sp.AAC.1